MEREKQKQFGQLELGEREIGDGKGEKLTAGQQNVSLSSKPTSKVDVIITWKCFCPKRDGV